VVILRLFHSVTLGPLKAQRRKEQKMSTIVLLNKEGGVERKLHFTTLPPDFIIPEGRVVSWKAEDLHKEYGRRSNFYKPPPEANFYFGDAWGQIQSRRTTIHNNLSEIWKISITTQGTEIHDVMQLRDRLLDLVQFQDTWSSANDLNPKPSIWSKLR